MSNRFNICIINEHPIKENCGGVQTVSFLLKKKLEELGYNIYCFHLDHKTKNADNEFSLPDTTVINSRTNFDFLYNKITSLDISVILFQGYIGELMELCVDIRKKKHVKLIYTYHRDPQAPLKEYDDYKDRILNNAKTAIDRCLKRIVLELKKPLFKYRCKREIRSSISKYDMEHIDAFVTLDEKYKEFIKSLYPTRYHKKFHTIINPIKINEYSGSFSKEKYILFIARHTYQKRLDRLLYIWKEIQQDFPEWELIVVGDGEHHQQYVETAQRLNLKNVVFTGKQPATEFYKKCSIICMTSSHEGLPMTLIEAQVYGCVPIAYDSFGSARRIIIHEYNGILIKPFKQKYYSKSLQRLMTDANLRERLSSNGIKHVHNFDIDIIIKDWILLFGNL